jgi:hypothetical protein
MPQSEPTGNTGLPELADIFHALRRGRHINAADGSLFVHLCNHFAAYQTLLQDLGFRLKRHPREFFYLEDTANFTDIAGKMALFVFVLVESLADQGLPIEETMMSRSFALAELPHLHSDRYRELMREAEVTNAEQLGAIINYLDRYGFVCRKPDDQFEFLAPAYRFLDICQDYARRAEGTDARGEEDVGDSKSEGEAADE